MGGTGAPTLSTDDPPSARVRMVAADGSAIVNTDLTAARNEYFFKPPAWLGLESMIKDERDYPMLYLIFNMTVSILPAALWIFRCRDLPWWAPPLYTLSIYALFFQRYVLCLHYSEHRKIFVKRYAFLNGYLQYVMAPFMGIPAGMYHLHHVVMHHKENNVFPWDLSSTEPYQRDHFGHFLHYLLRYMFAAWVELPFYAVRRGKYKLAAYGAACSLGYVGSVWYLWARVNAAATAWVFIIPMAMSSFCLMFGNWSQHIFVDPAVASRRDSDSCNYGLAYNCMNHFENQKTFNDGYHIIHHIKPGLHWTQLPEEFARTLDRHAKEKALVFTAHFFEVGLWAFTRNYSKLCSHMVHLLEEGEELPSTEATTRRLRSMLAPIHPVAETQKTR